MIEVTFLHFLGDFHVFLGGTFPLSGLYATLTNIVCVVLALCIIYEGVIIGAFA